MGCNKSESNKFDLGDEYYNKNTFTEADANKIKELQKNKSSYIIYTYMSFCTFKIPCEDIFKNYMEKNSISFVKIPYEEFENTEFIKTVKYAPSVIIINKGKIIAYLDAENNDDLNKYQNLNEFSKWIKKYINLK